MRLEAVALISLGRHPVSLRPRLPDLDARAVGLAVRAGARVTAVHAGAAAASDLVLRTCLGLGAERAVLIETGSRDDPLPALLAWLAANRGDVVLAGECAETGEGSGMAPYRVAEALGCALIGRALGFEADSERVTVTQTLPGGRRRILEASAPLVLTVDRSAPPAPLCAIGPSLRGRVARERHDAAAPDEFQQWIGRPGRKRPRRLAPLGAGAGERDKRCEVTEADPVAAADAILDFLERESMLHYQPALD